MQIVRNQCRVSQKFYRQREAGLEHHGNDDGEPLVCADDPRMAGPGQVIYWVASREAALTLDPWFVPVDDAIVGLVDEVRNYNNKELDQ